MEELPFAAEGKGKTIIETRLFEHINGIRENLENGDANARIVLTFD